jgi:6-phospho-beta-glucosidase
MFPKDFLWGSSISAYQAEGGTTSDGKKISIADLSTQGTKFSDNSISSDFYNHYKEDIKLLADMGAKMFRFTLSWARIIPDGDGEINQKGLDFYDAVLDELEKYGIEPLATIYHYELPVALQEKYNGWENRQVVDDYARFAEVCLTHFGKKINKFITINEPDILTMYGGHGMDLDDKQRYQRNKLIVCHHFALAHARAVELCKKICPNAMIGASFGYVPVYAASKKPADRIACMNLSDVQNSYFQELFLNGRYMKNVLDYYKNTTDCLLPDIEDGDLDFIKNNKCNFIALNYYKSDTCGYETSHSDRNQTSFGHVPGYYSVCDNPNLEPTDWGWEIDPIGIRVMLRDVYYRYHLPIIITENGMAAHEELEGNTVHDLYRIDYLKKHLSECKKAIDEGVELIGYCNWSFIDLISTGHGFEKRYGLIYVDHTDQEIGTLKRYPKDSYYWYKNIIESNGKDL